MVEALLVTLTVFWVVIIIKKVFYYQLATNLDEKQKSLLKEYINNMSNTTKFKDYLAVELPQIVKELKTIKSKISDKVTTIKLSETISVLEKMKIGKTVTDNNVSSIMLSYELIKELKSKVNVK